MKISIIGGGITGLTTAIALNRKGINARVFEAAEEMNEIGAGVWLQPNAMRVLDLLGLKETILQNGAAINKMEITNQKLKPFKEIKAKTVEDEYGNRTIGIHRGLLQKLLFEEASKKSEIFLGHKLESIEAKENKSILNFEKQTIESDIILGCDGIHSNVRKTIFPKTELRNSGQICWRGIAEFELPSHLKELGKECWGNQIRFGFSEIAPGKVYWFGVAKNNGETSKLQLQDLPKFLKEFDPLISEIIKNTTSIHTGTLSDLKRLEKWSNNTTCLLGDAAHATTPNMGQGACQGIEDAYYIAELLSKNQAQLAFEQFEKLRRKKVDYVVNNSWRFGKMAHSKMGQSLMIMLMKTTPQSVLDKTMKKLYRVDF